MISVKGDCVIDQPRLADARLAYHEQHATVTGGRFCQPTAQSLHFAIPADQQRARNHTHLTSLRPASPS
jgi:hypothetical protein